MIIQTAGGNIPYVQFYDEQYGAPTIFPISPFSAKSGVAQYLKAGIFFAA